MYMAQVQKAGLPRGEPPRRGGVRFLFSLTLFFLALAGLGIALLESQTQATFHFSTSG